MTQRIRECVRIVVVAVALAAATTLFGVGDAWADPPTRVARLSYVSGAVSFSPAGDDQWAQAALNRPLVTGDRVWSDAGGRGELAFDNGALWLGAATSLVVSNMDDSTAQFELQQGVLDLRVRQLPQGAVVEVDTPNLAFQVTRPGRYRLVVDPQNGTTSVIVKSGAAAVYGEQASYAIAGGESYRFRVPTCRTAVPSRSRAATNSSASSTSATGVSPAWLRRATYRLRSWATRTSTSTAHGSPTRNTATSGTRGKFRAAGRRIATATGRGSIRGDGPGSTRHRGDSPRSTTGAGRT